MGCWVVVIVARGEGRECNGAGRGFHWGCGNVSSVGAKAISRLCPLNSSFSRMTSAVIVNVPIIIRIIVGVWFGLVKGGREGGFRWR